MYPSLPDEILQRPAIAGVTPALLIGGQLPILAGLEYYPNDTLQVRTGRKP